MNINSLSGNINMNMLKELKFKDFVTFTGTFCGISSIILSLERVHPIYPASLVLLSILLDTLDGYIARKFNQINELGKELDSLSDVICFGVAPAVLIYRVYSVDYFGIMKYDPYVLLIPCAFFIIAAVIRLAWFNIDEGEGYTGLPVPISAGLMIALFLLNFFSFLISEDSLIVSSMVIIIPIIMCVMAIFNMAPFLVYGKNVRKKGGFVKILLLLVAILTLAAWVMSFFYTYTAPIIISIIVFIIVLDFCYILYGFISFLKMKRAE